MKSEATNVPTYLEEIPEDRREALNKIRLMITTLVPQAVEGMEYGMPTYSLDGFLFAFASQKNYMALYISDTDLLEKYRGRFGKLSLGKSCVRFRKLEDLPLDITEELLKEVVRRRLG
jgi:uncharacterized protein YdhG (YjbR/CyaY superfamily)